MSLFPKASFCKQVITQTRELLIYNIIKSEKESVVLGKSDIISFLLTFGYNYFISLNNVVVPTFPTIIAGYFLF